MSLPTSPLLSLPQEIKDQIWAYAYSHIDIPLYADHLPGDIFPWNPYTTCEACWKETPIAQPALETVTTWGFEKGGDIAPAPQISRRRHYTPAAAYNHHFRRLLVCKSMLRDILPLFLSTLTFHIKTGEVIALFRNTAPTKLKNTIANIVMYVHFDDNVDHFLTCMRLFELSPAFPALQNLKIKFHMRAPGALENLADATYLSIPLLGTAPPFNQPRYVLTDVEAAKLVGNRQPGLTIETAYDEHQVLFELEVLGTVTTAESIDEHTAVLRDLFTDEMFTNAVQALLKSNSRFIYDSIAKAWPPNQYPEFPLSIGFPDQSHFAECQTALLHVARRHEKPWIERLQKRRIVQIFVDQCAMSREAAEQLLERQLKTLPEGQSIEYLMDALMTAGTDEGTMANILGLPLTEGTG